MTKRLGPAGVAAAGLLLLAACRPDASSSGPSADATGTAVAAAVEAPGVEPTPAVASTTAATARVEPAPPDSTAADSAGGPVASSAPGSGDDRRKALLPMIDHTKGRASAGAGAGAAAAAAAGSAPLGGTCGGIAQRDGQDLTIDGELLTFFGVNAPYFLDDELPEAEVEQAMVDLAARGVNTVRVWYFAEHDPQRFARLLDLGRRTGIRFVVTLEDNVFEGRDWFFSDDDEHVYRPHLQAAVSEFKDRPEILMWEVVNEPNCGDRFDDACLKTIKDWLTMSSRMVKSIDGCHLVTTGMIGAGNYENEWANYRQIHKREYIDVASSHRRTGEDRSHDLEQAAEAGRPIIYGEVYDVAYDGACSPLTDSILKERAERVKDDLRDSIEDGVDGYLLWDYAIGTVELESGGVKHYCGEHGFERDDPLWDKLAAEPLLPAPVPWAPAP